MEKECERKTNAAHHVIAHFISRLANQFNLCSFHTVFYFDHGFYRELLGTGVCVVFRCYQLPVCHQATWLFWLNCHSRRICPTISAEFSGEFQIPLPQPRMTHGTVGDIVVQLSWFMLSDWALVRLRQIFHGYLEINCPEGVCFGVIAASPDYPSVTVN